MSYVTNLSMLKITHIGRNFSAMYSGSKKLRELFPGLVVGKLELVVLVKGGRVIIIADTNLIFTDRGSWVLQKQDHGDILS